MRKHLPFGLWSSPITPAGLASDKKLRELAWDTDGSTLVWCESRSDASVLVAQFPGEDAPRDITSGHTVRAEVGYGGGDFTVSHGVAYFVSAPAGRIFRQPLAGGPASPITPGHGKASSPVVSPDGRWVAYVHHSPEEEDCIAVVDSLGQHWPRVLAKGRDFYMQPRFSPDGQSLAFIAWDHPNMPWDGTELFLLALTSQDGYLPAPGALRCLAGGRETAIFQPEFSSDSRHLFFVSDATGWGRLARLELSNGAMQWLTPDGAEFAQPAWAQGGRSYCVSGNGSLIFAARSMASLDDVVRIDLATGALTVIPELKEMSDAFYFAAAPNGVRIACCGSSPLWTERVYSYEEPPGASARCRVVARASGEIWGSDFLAAPVPLLWPTETGETVHGLFYAPHSPDHASSGLPPVLVIAHGGPTSQVKGGWRPETAFFTSRGYAVLFVNYRGSTGHGREYMLRLRNNWGLCDLEDVCSAVSMLQERQLADKGRAVIMGGSAGGYTVLRAMTERPEVFAAGISLYGVADLFALAADTHKFEARYLDQIVGPLPEAAAEYRRRSPIYFADRIRRPLALFHGEIDKVVPIAQSQLIADVLKRRQVPHLYHAYAGEGHGWRKKETREHYFAAVAAFLKEHVVFAAW